MKTIGLIGGMSWESTETYYRKLNELVREQKGGLHSAPCIIYSVDFHQIEKWQREGNWHEAGKLLASIAQKLEKAGAEAIFLCTNTMHKVADCIEPAISIPFIHIGKVTAKEAMKQGQTNLLLLGTSYTMEQEFLKNELEKYGLNISIPKVEQRQEINRIIFNELCLGNIKKQSVEMLEKIIKEFESGGGEGVILGCTELNLLVKQKSFKIEIYDTTELHVKAALQFMSME
ncbi:aspartate/glutamate racemase family protein [Evansella sp. AB-rgal1]|uniref:aspartate/glutamate racemase family protein n=1 Tax=Evansella sp. AB-rgal1 TaxID=3242696 RepID=UPI00359D600B